MDKKELIELKNFYQQYLLNDVVNFWMKSDLIDRECGGFNSSVDQFGNNYNTSSKK